MTIKYNELEVFHEIIGGLLCLSCSNRFVRLLCKTVILVHINLRKSKN